MAFFPEPCFQSWAAYKGALRSSWPRFKARALARASVDREVQELILRSKNRLERSLTWWDLVWITVGGVVGSGIFVFTGEEARNMAGPAIVLSYIVAGFSSMLSAFCYTEFAIEIPVAGGSFAFLRVELGEFVAFLAAGNLVLEFVLSQGAVARGWTSSFAALINKRPDALRIHAPRLGRGIDRLDPIAAAATLILGIPTVVSTRFTSKANWVSTAATMVVVAFIVAAGFAKGDVANLSPFTPYGSKGIFTAATVVYYAYLGFDSATTLSEETRDPPRDIPRGIVASLALVVVVYVAMVLALCTLQRYSQLDTGAPFAFAFSAVGWHWAQYVVALAALKCMTSVLMLGILAEARYLTHISRTHVIPPWFAYVDPRTQTPVRVTLTLMASAAIVGFFTSLDVLASLFSISTLSVFILVAVALFVRRYYKEGETPATTLQLLLLLVLVGGISWAGAAVYYQRNGTNWIYYLVCFVVWAAATGSIQAFIPQVRKPKSWGTPFVPWVPAGSIAVNVFLLGSIDKASYVRFGVMTVLILVYYFFVGLHATYEAADEGVQTDSNNTLREDNGNNVSLAAD